MKTKPTRPVLEEFEPRILYSADFAPAALAGLSLPGASEQRLLQAQETPAASHAAAEIAFIDVSLPDAQSLIDDLQAQRDAGRPIEIVRIGAGADGLTRISETLTDRTDVSAVHVLSHGSDGVLQLGNARLDAATLLARAGELAQWSVALTADADLLIYGCDVAASATGQHLLTNLAALTGADVAASSDLTGAAARGGDWALEFASGSIQAGSALSVAAQQSWSGLLLVSTNETLVNQTTTANQTTSAENRGSQQAVALDAAGNSVVVWTSVNQDGSGAGVYARRFDATGAAITGEMLINSTTTDNQRSARVVSDAAGNFVVTWTSANQDGTVDSVYMRRFNASGVALTAETRVNTTATGAQTDSVLAMNASNGDYVVAWQGEGPGDSAGIFFRRFNADGTAKDATDRLANLTNGGTENDPAVTMDANGNFVIFWEVSNKLYFQRFDAAGSTLGGRVQVDNLLSTSSTAAVASDAAGDFTVVYRENVLLPGIWGKGFNADGTIKYSWFQADTGDAASPSIDMASDGSFVLVYDKAGSGTDVFARKYNADGSAAGAAFQINQTSSSGQSSASVAVVDTNNFVVVWSGNGPGDTNGVFARQYGPPNVAPAITSNGAGANAAISIAENATAVTTVTATDADLSAQTLTYSISGGADAAKFSINGTTGVLSFITAPNYEAPTDAGANNVYDVTVQVSDGTLTDTQAIAVTVTPLNDNNPVITSNGSGASAAISVAENATAVTTVTATDADLPAQTLTYSISGGSDAARFAINASTGVLSFIAAPNYELPTDAGANNVYDVIVQASDGTLTDTQAVSVTVTPVNDNNPVITSGGGGPTAAINVAENVSAVTTVTASDADLPAPTLTYSISGGADAARFSINASTGALSFVTAPNYEAPTDAGADNVYNVIVQASDGTRIDTQAITVTVTPANDNNPVITSNGGGATTAVNVAENATAVTTVTATDADLPAQTLTYSISGGADAAKFTINASTGVLRFIAAPNYEAPTDAGANNVYDVTVQASDGTLTDTQAIAVSVTPLNDNNPVITSNGGGASAAVNVAENSSAVTTVIATDADLPAQTLTYSISGGADAARFAINASTGVLNFLAAPNYEVPTDAGANNVYDVTVQVSDGTLTDTQAIAVTVTPVSDNNPVITSNGAGATAAVNVAENVTAVTTVTATDADLPAQTLTYSISGGADAAKFTINAGTGVLSFSAAPNYEAPADAGANNVYDVIVQASDGTLTDTQAIAVTVTPVNDNNPVITSNGGGASAAITVAENTMLATTVTATDADLPVQTLTYSISGGADAAKFSINSTTGALSFVAAPNYEAPTDAGANNVYDVTVRVSDGTLTDTQAIAVTVTDVSGALIVNTTADVLDGDTSSIEALLVNRGTDGLISLREAVIAANNTGGLNVIQLPAGTFTLTRLGANETAGLTGDLNLSGTLSLQGTGSALTVVDGGGIDRVFDLRSGAVVSFTGLTVRGGDAGNQWGGGINAQYAGSGLTLNDVRVTGNSGDSGAGIYNYKSTLLISDSTIDGNSGKWGAGLYNDGGTASLNRVTIDNNLATQDGAGIYNTTNGATLQLSNVTLSGNQASGSGGGLYTKRSVTVVNSTIAFNTAASGGGIFIANPGSVSLLNTIVAVNTGDNANTAVTSLGNNIDSGSTLGLGQPGDQSNTDPLLAALQNNGGATNTHALLLGSAAIDAGNALAAPPTDQRGTLRAGVADIGAYEYTGTANTAPVNAIPGAQAAFEDTATPISGVSVADPQGGGGIAVYELATTVLSVSNGTLQVTLAGAATISAGANNGAALTIAGTQADINATLASLVYRGNADYVGGDTLAVLSRDGAGLTDTDNMTITVNAVNDAPRGVGTTLVVDKNGSRTLVRADFGYSDASGESNAFAAVLVQLPSAGTLRLNGTVLSVATEVSVAQLDAGQLLFQPATGADGIGYATIGFQVRDDGGTANGGVDLDPTQRTLSIDVVNQAPLIVSGGGAATALDLPENTTAVTIVAASDANADTLTYSIVGGADAARFAIDSSTGVLSFVAAPDYESPSDAGADNVYDVTVQVSDASATASQVITVTLTSVNESAPVITSYGGGASAALSVAENDVTVASVTATDPDLPAQTLTYSIVGGADAGRFTISSTTGALSFVAAPDREAPADSGGDNVYDVTVQVSDGTFIDSQAIAVTVIDVNDNNPVITSNGAGASASIDAVENGAAVTTVAATDADAGTTPAYSISGGADSAKFTIDSNTGELSFLVAPDYEAPTDAGGDNVYDVTVQAGDGSLSTTQAISVTVNPLNDNNPVISSDGGGAVASISVSENATAVTTVNAGDADLPAQTLTYSIVGGADQALFSINASTGVLSFVAAPDFETPGDAGADNVYDVTVQASDGLLTAMQAIAVTITAVNDNPPDISSDGGGASASINIAENTNAVTTVVASDADLPAQALTYSIIGGADSALFSINANTGVLSFATAPDYENPGDAGANNVYDVTVQVSDGTLVSTQAISVTVNPVDDADPVISSNGGGASASISVAEHVAAVTTVSASDADLPAQTLSYSIVGGADAARFTIDGATGALSFLAAPDYDAPTDANADNVYDVTVQVSDGTLTDTQTIAVTVTPANDNAPVITSDGAGANAAVNVAENSTAVTVVSATDADLPAQTLTYSLAGGSDAARFTIDASSGSLSFLAAPDFEAPVDANGDNVYDVIVRVSDGALSDTQAIAVTVAALDDNAPVITSNGGGANVAVNVAENTSAVTTVSATDADRPAQTLSYSIVGGADAARFTIDGTTGALSFLAAPDYEAPTDANADNVYNAMVQVSDGTLTDIQTIAVTITPANDGAPVIRSNGAGANAAVNVAENSTAVTTVGAADADLPAQALNYSIAGGADAARFTIDASTGALSFVAAPDFEAPVDANSDNVYDVIVQVSDGGLTDTQLIAVTVTALNDNAPVITSDGGGATAVLGRAENATAVTTVAATDADSLDVLRFAITGGADAARFTIDPVSGALSFVAAPDVETPADANADNRYEVTVTVSDGTLSAQQALFVDVGNVDEAPTIVTNVLLLSKDGATIVLLGTDPDTAASALNYQASGQVGGRFELVATPGVAVTGFSQAQVDAGGVRFVPDGSGAGPTYVLSLSDGVSTVISGAPNVVVQAALPAATFPVAAATPVPDPTPNPASAATAAAPAAPQTAVPPVVLPAPGPVSQALLTDSRDEPFEPTRASSNGIAAAPPAASTATRDSTVTAVATLAQFALLSESSDNTSTSGAPTIDLASALRDRLLGEQLDHLRDGAQSSQRSAKDVQAASAMLTAGLSVGYVLWLARGGVLVASLMSALPAWAMVDPLPVLAQMKRRDGEADDGAADDADDPLEKLFSRARRVVARGATPALTASTPTDTTVASGRPAADPISLEQPA